jgi:hypothetical protein
MKPSAAKPQPHFLGCGGKRSATPLSGERPRSESGVVAPLCHRNLQSFVARARTCRIVAQAAATRTHSFRLSPGYEQSIGVISLKRPLSNWMKAVLRARPTPNQIYEAGMQVLKRICQTAVGLFKKAWLFPHFVAVGLKQRRRQFELNVLEAERLDRIRHPSKYLGR